MQVISTQYLNPCAAQHAVLPTLWYSVLGVPVSVASDVVEVLQCVDDTYAAFRCTPGMPEAEIALHLRRLDDGMTYLVSDAQGYARRWPEQQAALLDLLDHLVHALLARLHSQGIYAIHASAAVYRSGALIMAGRSGQGKTTLVLGLLRRGLCLLSDEFAVVEQETQRILPYRRSLHIRPGTPELIPELHFLEQLPRHQLGGGIEWALAPHDLEQALPGCLASAAPLRYVLLLEGTPCGDGFPALTSVPAALAALELVRGTWAASVDFEGGLSCIGQLLHNVPCARLRAGALEATLDLITAWLETNHG